MRQEAKRSNRIIRKTMHRVTRALKDERQFDPSDYHPWPEIQPLLRKTLKEVLREEGVE